MRKLTCLAIVSFLCASAVNLQAQSESASIVGTITDASGAVIPGASVTIRNDQTNATFTIKTGQDGLYTSQPLAAGAWTVSAEQQGFKRTVRSVTLDVDQHARIDLGMQPGDINQSVTVEAQGELLDTQSAELGNVRTTQAVNDLPLNGRDFVSLTYLAPGTSATGGGFTQTAGASNQLGLQGVSVNGIRNGNNTYNFDGIHSQDNEYSVMILLPSPDAIQEFKMQSSGRDATAGRTGGALVNLVTKSGGNGLHGTAFEFFRNSDLDARNFFDPHQIPAFHQNQFGGSVGGPIRHDKTFFFVDIQKSYTIQGQSFLQSVPTQLEKQGNFSQISQVIYNPYTQVGNVRMPFQGNIIPASMINATGQIIANLYPAQDLPGLANNFSYNPARTLSPLQGDERIDHRFSDNDQIFERVSVSDVHPNDPGYFPQYASGPLYPGPYDSTGTQAVVGYTHIFSPSFLFEFRGGYSRLNNLGQPPNFPNQFMNQIGIPGIDNYGLQQQAVANFAISGGYGAVGGSGNIPFIKTTDNYQTSYHFTNNHDKHTIRWGYDLFRRTMNTVQAGSPSGAFSFTGGFTQNPASPSGTGNGLADALLGLDASGSLSVWQEVGTKRWEHGLFIQDDYRVNNKLTLNIGLRYEITTPWSEEHNRLADFVPSLDAVLPVGTPQVPGNTLYHTNWADFGPRVGLAYSINSKTVFRASWGYFYDFTSTSVNSLGTENAPYGGNLAITNTATLNPATSGFIPLSMGFLPYQSIGTFSYLSQSVSYWFAHQPDSSVQQRNASLQRQLPLNTVLTVAWVGTRGEHLTLTPNLNIPAPGPGSIPARRPYPNLTGLTAIERSGDSYYNGLQATAEKRFAQGLAFLASFSWAHSIDENSAQAAGSVQNIQCYACDRGNSDFDIRQHLVLSWSYELPIGKGKTFGSGWHGPAQAILGGWKLNSIDTFQTGSPFSISPNANTLNNGSSQRANYIGGPVLSSVLGPNSSWINQSSFATPALYMYGNSGRNIATGPGTNQIDLSLFKAAILPGREGMRGEFRVETFNLFNKPQFNNPSGTLGLPTTGLISSAGYPYFFSRTSREIQLAFKFYF